jgi:hypothetical protein
MLKANVLSAGNSPHKSFCMPNVEQGKSKFSASAGRVASPVTSSERGSKSGSESQLGFGIGHSKDRFPIAIATPIPTQPRELGAPKARKNKAQGGRASEASSETLGSDRKTSSPEKATQVECIALAGLALSNQSTQGGGAQRRNPGLCSAAISALDQMPRRIPVTGCLIQRPLEVGCLAWMI